MSVPYRQLLRMVGARVNAVPGATQTVKESNYLTSPLTITQLGSRDFNFSLIKDICVAVLGEIVEAYASVINHPFRVRNLSQTSDIAHKGSIPSIDSSTRPIVGVYGVVRDVATNEVMTKQPLQVIQTIVDDTDNFLKRNYYYYDIVDRIIYHTQTNVNIDVCTFSASDELGVIASNGNIPVPDACLAMAVDGIAARMIVDDEFFTQAQVFNSYYQAGLALYRSGGMVYQPAPIPDVSVSAKNG
jgi:hypothetical protein